MIVGDASRTLDAVIGPISVRFIDRDGFAVPIVGREATAHPKQELGTWREHRMISRAVMPTRRSRTWVFLWIALFLMGILLQYGVALSRPGIALAATA